MERMQLQRMTVIDLSMSYVYGAVGVRLLPHVVRQLQRVWRNARDGWTLGAGGADRRSGDRAESAKQ